MVDRRRGGRGTAGRPAAAVGGAGKGADAPQKKGEKGAGKGKDDMRKGAMKGNGKSKGDGKGKPPVPPPQERNVMGVKTVQELEAEMLHSKMALGTTKERREASKTPQEAKGNFCEVKKHSDMGCAVVSFVDQASRDAVMRLAETKGSAEEKKEEKRALMKISGVDVQLRAHFDKAKQEEIKTDIFVAWVRQQEKQ